jgi:FkbM family methyltransferase
MQWLNHGCLADIEGRLDGISLPAAADVVQLAALIRDARKAQVAVTRHGLTKGMLNMGPRPEFEFLKTGFHLLQHNPKAVIWQIGAADGIMADPLRPLMVNFDPQAVLIEPNPYMFDRLLKNYASNKNVKAINAVFGGLRGRMVLNAINPEKVMERNLPEWALGISSAFKDRNAIGGRTETPEMAVRIQECVETIEVDQVDVHHVLASSGYPAPDILVVDVEGMDFEVIRCIVEAGIAPGIIHFEICCLPGDELKKLHGLLASRYLMFQFGNDVTAYRHDFFGAYCESIYMENGISFTFREALRFINHLDSKPPG